MVVLFADERGSALCNAGKDLSWARTRRWGKWSSCCLPDLKRTLEVPSWDEVLSLASLSDGSVMTLGPSTLWEKEGEREGEEGEGEERGRG